MLKLSRERSIFGDNGPAIGQRLRLRLTRIDHWLNGKDHPGPQALAGIRLAIMEHLGIFVQRTPDAVPDQFAHHRKTLRLRVGLNGRANIAQALVYSRLLNAE